MVRAFLVFIFLATLQQVWCGPVTVCGHAFPFPSDSVLEGAEIKAYVKRNSFDEPKLFGVTKTNATGAYCFTNLPGSSKLSMIISKSGYLPVSGPTLQLPESGCYQPEQVFQVPSSPIWKGILFLEWAGGSGRSMPPPTQCVAVTTVTRPCQGMYSRHSHGLKGTELKLLQLQPDGSSRVVPSTEVPKIYAGVTALSTPLDILPDSTSFLSPNTMMGKLAWKYTEQFLSEDSPSSWDGGVFFWGVSPGVYRVETSCKPFPNGTFPFYCPADTIFSTVEFSCKTDASNKEIELINCPPGSGPRPVNGSVCTSTGPLCGIQVPNPGDPSDKAGFRTPFYHSGQCQYSDPSLMALMGSCGGLWDTRFQDRGIQQTNRDYWEKK